LNFNFDTDEDEKLKALNDSILATARAQLEQNRRLIQMIEVQVVQIDRIKILINSGPFETGAELATKIHKVLYT